MNDSLQPSAVKRVILIGETLIKLKRAKSLAEICRKMDINRNYFSELKRGKYLVSSEVAELLINTYNISRKYIYEGDGKMFDDIKKSSDSQVVASDVKNASINVENVAFAQMEETIRLLKEQLQNMKDANQQLIDTNALLVKMLSLKGEQINAHSVEDASK